MITSKGDHFNLRTIGTLVDLIRKYKSGIPIRDGSACPSINASAVKVHTVTSVASSDMGIIDSIRILASFANVDHAQLQICPAV